MKYSDIIEKYKDGIGFLALHISKDGRTGLKIGGTCFVAGEKGKILTCAHLYNKLSEQEKEQLFVSLPVEKKGRLTKYGEHKLSLIAKDDENDVALFQADKLPSFIKPIPMGNDEIIVAGDDVGFVGFPIATSLLNMGWGITLSANKCIIGAVKWRGVDQSLHFFQLDTHIRPGNSGSPLFSFDQGKVIGIAAGHVGRGIEGMSRANIPQMIGIARPICYGKKLLEKAGRV